MRNNEGKSPKTRLDIVSDKLNALVGTVLHVLFVILRVLEPSSYLLWTSKRLLFYYYYLAPIFLPDFVSLSPFTPLLSIFAACPLPFPDGLLALYDRHKHTAGPVC